MPAAPPYALAAPLFPFRALALLAARAPLGGPREVALATLIAARLASATVPPALLDVTLRARRAEAARQWMGSVTLPASARAALLKLVACSAEANGPATHAALSRVTEIAGGSLDRAARSEIDRLLTRLAP